MLCSKGDIGASIGAVCDILRPVWDYWEQYGTIGVNMGTIRGSRGYNGGQYEDYYGSMGTISSSMGNINMYLNSRFS